MANFDLGEDLTVVRDVPVGLSRTYALSRRVVQGYEALGYTVVFEDEQPPTALRAAISDAKGARLGAHLELTRVEGASRLTLNLRGRVVVGGMQAMFATPAMVKKVARQRLEELLFKTFDGIEPEPEAAVAEPDPVSEPEPASDADSSPQPVAQASESHCTYAKGSLEYRLALVKDLYERGLIGQDDYRTKKAALLSSL